MYRRIPTESNWNTPLPPFFQIQISRQTNIREHAHVTSAPVLSLLLYSKRVHVFKVDWTWDWHTCIIGHIQSLYQCAKFGIGWYHHHHIDKVASTDYTSIQSRELIHHHHHLALIRPLLDIGLPDPIPFFLVLSGFYPVGGDTSHVVGASSWPSTSRSFIRYWSLFQKLHGPSAMDHSCNVTCPSPFCSFYLLQNTILICFLTKDFRILSYIKNREFRFCIQYGQGWNLCTVSEQREKTLWKPLF